MESKRIFLKEANDLFSDTSGRKLSGDTLVYEFKSSAAYQAYDMIKYYMDDSDKAHMMIWDSGEVFSKNYKGKRDARNYLNEGYVSYCKSMLKNTERLMSALQEEIAAAKMTEVYE